MSAMMRKAVLPVIVILAFSGTVASLPAPAEAQVYYRGWGGGYPGYGGGYGWHRPAYHWSRPVYGYGGPYGYRYAPVYRYGYYGRPYYGYGYPYYHHRRSNGGAVAASLIGGLALGALAAQAARPAYAYPARTHYRDCFVERRRVVTRGGRVVVRRVRSCY